MSAQQDFLRYLGVAGTTLALCFAGQEWLGSYLDVHWHAQLKDRPANADLTKIRTEESHALSEANIEKAMEQVASSRTSDPRIAPKPSTDLSPMSGWVQQPDFKPYEPEVVQRPSAASAGTEAGTQ